MGLYPHLTAEESATVTTLGDGKVTIVPGTFGTDYAFLSDMPTQATADDADYTGTAASVQHRPTGIVLVLGAAVSVH